MRHDVDLRVRRTRKVVQAAFIELVEERGFDANTVGDIAQRAMINRATFYRHYQDKYDLVEQIFQEVVTTMSQEMGTPTLKLSEVDPENTPEPWVTLFEHFGQHARLYRALLGKNGSAWFITRLREYIVEVLLEREREREHFLQQGPRPAVQLPVPKEIASHFLAALSLGVVTWWLESDMAYTPVQVATWFRRFVLRGYHYALEGSVTPGNSISPQHGLE